MNSEAVSGAIQSIREMDIARQELGRVKGKGYMTTAEAVRACPFRTSAEELIGYPEHVMPRLVRNPLAKRPSYLWDPRDLRNLPLVLGQWRRALEDGPDAADAFRKRRLEQLEERDRRDLDWSAGEAA